MRDIGDHRLGPFSTTGRVRLGLAEAFVLLAVSACGTQVSETYLNQPPAKMAPRGPGSVLLYASGPPTRPHMDVAILQVEQSRGLNDQGLDLMLDRLRVRAAQLGCDGVVVGGIRERSGAAPGTAYHLLDPGATTLHGTCIVFTGARPATTPVQPAAAAPSRPSAAPARECPCRVR
jgi:hypothetical protein